MLNQSTAHWTQAHHPARNHCRSIPDTTSSSPCKPCATSPQPKQPVNLYTNRSDECSMSTHEARASSFSFMFLVFIHCTWPFILYWYWIALFQYYVFCNVNISNWSKLTATILQKNIMSYVHIRSPRKYLCLFHCRDTSRCGSTGCYTEHHVCQEVIFVKQPVEYSLVPSCR